MRNYDIFVAKIYDYALIDSFWVFPGLIDSPTSYATLGWSKFVQVLFEPISLSDFQDYENNFFGAQYLLKKIDIMSSQSLFCTISHPNFLEIFASFVRNETNINLKKKVRERRNTPDQQF